MVTKLYALLAIFFIRKLEPWNQELVLLWTTSQETAEKFAILQHRLRKVENFILKKGTDCTKDSAVYCDTSTLLSYFYRQIPTYQAISLPKDQIILSEHNRITDFVTGIYKHAGYSESCRNDKNSQIFKETQKCPQLKFWVAVGVCKLASLCPVVYLFGIFFGRFDTSQTIMNNVLIGQTGLMGIIIRLKQMICALGVQFMHRLLTGCQKIKQRKVML